MTVSAIMLIATSLPLQAQDEPAQFIANAPAATNSPAAIVNVPGGCFVMGCDAGEYVLCATSEQPMHGVCLDDFFIDAHEVTQKEFERVMGFNPSARTGCPDCPVENVTWHEALSYCLKTGRTLPTEAQWEYAARSGGKAEIIAGTVDLNQSFSFAWTRSISSGQSHPVGTLQPNGLGLFDMSGNVTEWVLDWYDTKYYGLSPRDNPQGPPSGIDKTARGGSWLESKIEARTMHRLPLSPGSKEPALGFRCGGEAPLPHFSQP